LPGVEIAFEVDGVPWTFRRNGWTGRAELQVGSELVLVQSPVRPSTHVNVRTRKVWRRIVNGQEVEVEKVRPRVWGGLRDNSFTVSVGGEVVAQGTGK
jgi:hypothetical protein